MISMYSKKKKKLIDPNAPPRPTLLGHEKEMKGWREQFTAFNQQNFEQAQTIAFLKRKINRLEAQVDALTSIINRIK
jgi:hypothetical protein